MNAYDQLREIREQLEEREAGPETIRLVDQAIKLAEPEQDNPLSISQAMMLRHLLRMPAVKSNHYIEMDLMGLQVDTEDQRGKRDTEIPDGVDAAERRPQHTHGYYRKQREQQKS